MKCHKNDFKTVILNCYKRKFLLKFPRDRRRWIEWLYRAKKRYSGLSVLNYNEIQYPRKRKGIIDLDRLVDLLGFENYEDLKKAHYKWLDSAVQTENRPPASLIGQFLHKN